MQHALEMLRARIRELEGNPAGERERLITGIETFDRLTGGLPRPGMVEVTGPPGSGCTALAASFLRQQERGVRAAWVDVQGTLYPPALAALGVPLEQLVLVRPPATSAVWVVEQLVRSGCFPVVVASGVDQVGLAGSRWAHACQQGACSLVILADRPTRALPADVRVSLRRGRLMVARNRGAVAGLGAAGALPPPDPTTRDLRRAVSWLSEEEAAWRPDVAV